MTSRIIDTRGALRKGSQAPELEDTMASHPAVGSDTSTALPSAVASACEPPRSQTLPNSQEESNMTPPILFLHGAFADGGAFDAWMPYFEAAGFECHNPSLPGRHPTDLDALRQQSMADNYAAALRARKQLSEPPIVIGHSMGGLLAQHVAARSECSALVLLAASPPGVLWAHPKALRHLVAMMPKILTGRPLRPSDQTLAAVVFNELSETEAQRMTETIVPDSGQAFRAQVLGTTPRIPRDGVQCPVLVLSGDEDINGSSGIPRRLAKRYGARHRVIGGCDHWMVAPSRVESVCPVITDWLRELELAPLPRESRSAQRTRANPSASSPPLGWSL